MSEGVFPSLGVKGGGGVRQAGADENFKEAGGGFPSVTSHQQKPEAPNLLSEV